jgi:hypothetical protein
MFGFNDAYIGVVAGGLSDEDTLSLFQEAFEEMDREFQVRVDRLPGNKAVAWDDDGPYVDLDGEEVDREYGTEDQMAAPAYRPAFIQARFDAERAFQEVLQS